MLVSLGFASSPPTYKGEKAGKGVGGKGVAGEKGSKPLTGNTIIPARTGTKNVQNFKYPGLLAPLALRAFNAQGAFVRIFTLFRPE